MYGTIPSSLPRVTYGPWSKVNTSKNPTPSSGPLKLVSAVSDDGTESTAAAATSASADARPSRSRAIRSVAPPYTLFRVYVFSDSRCVNVIYRGAITGGPSYAPRTTGPLALPQSAAGRARGSVHLPRQTARKARRSWRTPPACRRPRATEPAAAAAAAA